MMQEKDNSTKMNFVKTSDAETANKLRACGFTEITEPHSSIYCFINDGKMVYEDDNKKIVLTNVLCI